MVSNATADDARWQYRPGSGSNAIDAVAAADCLAISSGPNPLFDHGATVAADGRGQQRPADGNGDSLAHCDIGATEFQPRISITLVAGSAADTLFPFVGDFGSFTLSDPGESQRPFDQQNDRTYWVQEVIPPGWRVVSIVCSGDSDAGSTAELLTASVQIDLDPGEYINCTFVNELEAPPPTGGITILHEAQPADDLPFAYSGDMGDFELADPANASISFHDLLIGSYEIVEVVPPGWQLDAITCQGDADGGSVVGLANAAVTIDLDANELISCTFRNQQTEPPPVVVTDLAADIEGVAVNVQWETTAEADLLGFQVQRATSAAGPYTPLNSALIAPQGEGFAYTYTDAAGSGTFYYRVVSVLENHETTNFGPLKVEVIGHSLYFPFQVKH
jgi:hypothetical protein